jgi:hypothetical protein
MDQTRLSSGIVVGAALAATLVAACQRSKESSSDFAAMQSRGAHVMGVDQYTAAHVFEDLPDGGRVVLDRDDPADTAAIATIRAHMGDIQAAFRAGDFTKPFQVHAQTVPGTTVMRERRAAISYEAIDRPRGGEVRITSRNSAAVRAIHEFLAFQRAQHHAAGHEGMR